MVKNLKVYKKPQGCKLSRSSIVNTAFVAMTAVFLASSLYHFGGYCFDNETIGYTFDSRCGYVDAQRDGDVYTIKYFDGDICEYTFDQLSAVEPETEFLSSYKTRELKVSDKHNLLYHDIVDRDKKNHHFLDSIAYGGLAAGAIALTKRYNMKR